MAGQREVRPAHRQPQFEDALAVRRLAGDDRDAQFVFEPGNAHVKPRSHGEIHHVQHQDRGSAEIKHLMDQVQISLKIRRIDDADDAVRLRRVGPPAKEDIAHNCLVGRSRGKRIGTRQINDGDGTPVLRIGCPGFLFNRDARIIPDLLPHPGQRVEQSALPAVGVANNRIDRSTQRKRRRLQTMCGIRHHRDGRAG